MSDMPAFPVVGTEVDSTGMTLRDYFAAQAMQGLLAAREGYTTDEIGDYAYDIADAMLLARIKG